jgi:hypothetical protein
VLLEAETVVDPVVDGFERAAATVATLPAGAAMFLYDIGR